MDPGDSGWLMGIRILYGLLALTFVAWGAGTLGLNRLEVVAEVRGQRITTVDIDREAGLLEQRFRQFTQGGALPANIDFRSQALPRSHRREHSLRGPAVA